MGNTVNTSDPNLMVYIETEKPYYNCGSSVEGIVFVEALQQYQYDALMIRVQGEQWCQWFEGSSKNRRKYNGNSYFYVIEHKLDEFNDGLHVGRYSYPFSIELSQNIPGSFHFSAKDAKIQYKLVAYFANYEKPQSHLISAIPLHIREPFRQQCVPFQGKTTKNPNLCGFFDCGNIELEVFFDRNVSFQNEKIIIEINVDNREGRQQITKLLIQLVQYTFLSSNSGVFRTFRKVIDSKPLNTLIKEGTKKKISNEYKVPQIEHPSAISTLVANYYRLEVSTKVGIFLSNNPRVSCYLFLMRKNPVVKPPPEPNLSMDHNFSEYAQKDIKIFKKKQHWFKKNKNLQVMNYRLEDAWRNV